ncbi:recombination regulator RecX [Verticiella sediminum]|uniref:Regulatory protein RecX n=1 Tax=Verticiella sediminum TaxID=1247510 RepID=A0A556A6G1_9BURK|nr:recombination regulator RecX [Verticiella sediminum]TSH88469.1 recombination regulator RecX [Verticiella sediminum]
MTTKPDRTEPGCGPATGPHPGSSPPGSVSSDVTRADELPPELEGLPAAAFEPLTDRGAGAPSSPSSSSPSPWPGLPATQPRSPEAAAPGDDAPGRREAVRRRGWGQSGRAASARAGGDEAPHPARGAGRSLKMRAVDYLSRREHSRFELSRKLARHAEEPGEVESVLDELAAQGLLSEARFAESLVNRKAGRLGTSRIVQELRQHGVKAESVAQVRAELAATELARAHEVWRKRFGRPADDPAGRAKQMRFLAARGFGHDVIRRVVAGADDLLDGD